MAKLNLGQVLANMAQATTGLMAGRTAGEAELRRRELEKQERVRQSHATMLNVLPLLGREGQATLLSGIMGEQENMALGRPFDYKAPAPVDMSGYQGMFGGGGREASLSPAPGALPAMTPTAPQGEFARFVGGLGGPQVENPPIPFPLRGPLRGYTPGLLPPISTPMAHEMATGQMPVAPTVPPHSERLTLPPLEQEEATQYVSRQAAPKAPPTPKGRTISTRFGELALRGVDPKEAQRVASDFERSKARIFQSAIVRDPNTQGLIQSAVRSFPTKPFSEWGEEELAQARQAQSSLDNFSMFLGGQGQKFQQDMDTAEVAQIGKDIEKLSGFRPDNLQQELIRLRGRVRGLMERGFVQVPSQFMAQVDDIDLMEQALAKGDKQKAGLILGLIKTELTPKPKDADPQKAFTDLLGQAPRWAKVDPATQGVYLKRLKQAAQDAGYDPAIVPNRIEDVMSDETKQRLGMERKRLDLAERREQRQAAHQKWQQDESTRRERQRKEKESGNLTEADQKRVGRLEAARDAMYQRRNKILEMAPVDLKPGSENAATKGIGDIDREIERLNNEIEKILKGAEKRGAARGSGGAGGGKAAVGSLMGELADPNRPENQKANAGVPKRRLYVGNDGRLTIKERMYRRYRSEGHSEAEARKMAEEDTAGLRPGAK